MKKINMLITVACVMSLSLAPSLSLFADESKSTGDCCGTESVENTDEHHHEGEETHEHHHDGDEEHEHHEGEEGHEHHHDGDEDHEHEHEHKPADPRYEGSVAYWGIYKFTKGEYQLQTGHTHEKHLKVLIVPVDNEETLSEELMKSSKTLMKTEGEEVNNEGTLKLEENKVNTMKLAHMSGSVNFNIEKDGNYALITNIAPSDALPYWLVDADENELSPVKEEILDDSKEQIMHGYFKDDMVKDRELKEWNGEWTSVYPLLKDGSLDEVMEAKSKTGKMSKDEYKAYYEAGYKTDVDSITISDNKMTFKSGDKEVTAEYKYDGYKILNYEKGNRGVRFLFSRVDEVEGAPKFVQFSDHNIAPSEPAHFHLFMGDSSQEELLNEMENWPTYYPASLSVDDIKAEMTAH